MSHKHKKQRELYLQFKDDIVGMLAGTTAWLALASLLPETFTAGTSAGQSSVRVEGSLPVRNSLLPQH